MRGNINDIMFPVKEVEAIGIMPSNKKGHDYDNIDNTGYKFIVREDTNDVLSCVTNNYKMVTNDTVNKASSKIIKKEGGKLKEVKSFGNGARSIVTWEFPDHKVKISRLDELTPEIVWQNSYDGTVGLNILAGAFRLICTNGAIIGVLAEKYKNKHSIYNVALEDIEGVIEETIRKTKRLMKDEFPMLYDTQVKEKHIVELLKLFPITASDYMTQYLLANRPRNLWDLFNAGTNVATHGMDRKMESTHKLESKIYKLVKSMATKEVGIA